MAHNSTHVGWKDQPDGRGTFDILKACWGTIFLLCWSSVCPNVPSRNAGRWAKLKGKLELFMLAILGPDFIFMVSLGQANAAWKSKKAFHERGYDSWNLRHCFFANMGGVHVQFPDRAGNGKPTFPVDCDQILYLVQNDCISLPDITKEDIEDRNKADFLVRGIALLQSIWFTINAFGRIAQGLFLTTLELTTLAFIFLMTACSICWWSKPMDVSQPVVIKAQKDLAEILQKANSPSLHLGQTPLSFLNRREWFMSKFWIHYSRILRRVRLLPNTRPKPTEADHFLSVDFKETDIKWEAFCCPLIPLYSCIFIAAWNFAFTTNVERTLWQAASITSIVYGVVGCLVAATNQHNFLVLRPSWWIDLWARMRGQRHVLRQSYRTAIATSREKLRLPSFVRKLIQWLESDVNVPPENDPDLTVSVGLWIVVTLLCTAYCASRAYILIEDHVGLRVVPLSAYQTVDWNQYSPIL